MNSKQSDPAVISFKFGNSLSLSDKILTRQSVMFNKNITLHDNQLISLIHLTDRMTVDDIITTALIHMHVRGSMKDLHDAVVVRGIERVLLPETEQGILSFLET